jgi:predicted RNA binding protein YcfA (HicA-like mRNA interferase family)
VSARRFGSTDIGQLLAKVAKSDGWEVAKRRGGHWWVTSPAGGRATVVASRCHGRAYPNTLADLRRIGWTG